MTDPTSGTSTVGRLPVLNRPEVREAVRRCFLAYDQALLAHDVDELGRWFHDGAEASRFGLGEELYGSVAVSAYRASGRRVVRGPLRRVEVVTVDDVAAVVTAEFDDGPDVGRQTQTWLNSGGWRILAGHVSTRRRTTP